MSSSWLGLLPVQGCSQLQPNKQRKWQVWVCPAGQFVANVTGSNPGGDLALVAVGIAPGLAGHTPAALLPPSSGAAGGRSPAPAPSGEVRVLVHTRYCFYFLILQGAVQ